MLLASHTVHVTSEANTSPTMTAWTTMSAVKNMDHGERSRGRWLLPITGKTAGPVGDCAWATEVRTESSTSPPTTLAVTMRSCAPALPLLLAMPIELRLGSHPTGAKWWPARHDDKPV